MEAGYCGYKQRGCCAAKSSSLAATLHRGNSTVRGAQKFARAGAMICKLSGLTRSLTGALLLNFNLTWQSRYPCQGIASFWTRTSLTSPHFSQFQSFFLSRIGCSSAACRARVCEVVVRGQAEPNWPRRDGRGTHCAGRQNEGRTRHNEGRTQQAPEAYYT